MMRNIIFSFGGENSFAIVQATNLKVPFIGGEPSKAKSSKRSRSGDIPRKINSTMALSATSLKCGVEEVGKKS